MNTSREAIYAALFALVSNAADLVTTGRRVQPINLMQPSALPALFQQQVGEEIQQSRGVPPRYTLRVDIFIYAINQDATQSATPQLNALMDAVEAAIAPDPVTGLQTLGGLVSHCFLSGKTDILDSDFGNRALAVMPLELLTT